jgi:hypothetical protein
MASSRRKIMDMERKLNLTKSTTGKSERIASALAKPAKLKPSEKAVAAAVINPRRVLDQSRALARAKGSVARAEKKAVAAKMLKATTGGTEKMKSMPKVKITGTATSKPRISGSMIGSQPKTVAKSKTKATSLTKKTSKK